MCGKFTQMASWGEVREFSDLMNARVNDEVRVFTPMRPIPVMHLDRDGNRVVTPMSWGYTDRKPEGRRVPKFMHARGETIDRKFADAFQHRRGVTWMKSFNEGEDIPTMKNGVPTGKTKTKQWTLRRVDGKPGIIGVIYDVFDVGRGLEHEFVQVTTDANELIRIITTRMVFLLEEKDLPLWLGETWAPIEEVHALIKPMEMGDEWEMRPEKG